MPWFILYIWYIDSVFPNVNWVDRLIYHDIYIYIDSPLRFVGSHGVAVAPRSLLERFPNAGYNRHVWDRKRSLGHQARWLVFSQTAHALDTQNKTWFWLKKPLHVYMSIYVLHLIEQRLGFKSNLSIYFLMHIYSFCLHVCMHGPSQSHIAAPSQTERWLWYQRLWGDSHGGCQIPWREPGQLTRVRVYKVPKSQSWKLRVRRYPLGLG